MKAILSQLDSSSKYTILDADRFASFLSYKLILLGYSAINNGKPAKKNRG